MKKSIEILFCLLFAVSWNVHARGLSLKWGLENTWSYRETERSPDEDAAVRSDNRRKLYRTFAFNDDQAVVNAMLKCFDRHFKLWDQYKTTVGVDGISKAAFERFKASQDPACDQHAKRQAPVLYFDFVADTKDQFVLESIEITTIRFSEYKGGGFFGEEAWYDLVLSHNKGKKRYDVSKRLVFFGTGRCELRFWSDNFYANQGWIAPMGEYMIDITFHFAVGDTKTSISTGPFKIDV